MFLVFAQGGIPYKAAGEFAVRATFYYPECWLGLWPVMKPVVQAVRRTRAARRDIILCQRALPAGNELPL